MSRSNSWIMVPIVFQSLLCTALPIFASSFLEQIMPLRKETPSLEESMAQLAENLAKLQTQFALDRSELASTISTAIATAINNRPSSSDNPFAIHEPQFTPHTSPHNLPVQPPKIHLPAFDGTEPGLSPSPNLRKGTPERKRTPIPLRGKVDSGGGDRVENTKPTDQHQWPARIHQANVSVLSKSLSLDCGVVEKSKINCSGNVIRALHQSMNLDSRRASVGGGKSSLDLVNSDLLNPLQQNPDGNSVKDSYMVPSDHTTSDTDSVSSGSTSGVQENDGSNRLRSGTRGIVVSAKFWQETLQQHEYVISQFKSALVRARQ